MDFVGKPILSHGQIGQKQMDQALKTLGPGHVSQEKMIRQKLAGRAPIRIANPKLHLPGSMAVRLQENAFERKVYHADGSWEIEGGPNGKQPKFLCSDVEGEDTEDVSSSGEEIFQDILERAPAAQFKVKSIVASAINAVIKRVEGRDVGLMAEDFDGANAAVLSHPIANIIFSRDVPRLRIHFQGADSFLRVTRKIGLNSEELRTPAFVTVVNTGLIQSAVGRHQSNVDKTSIIFVCDNQIMKDDGLLPERSLAHEMGHAIDPQMHRVCINQISILLRELTAFSGEYLSYVQLRKLRNLDQWLWGQYSKSCLVRQRSENRSNINVLSQAQVEMLETTISRASSKAEQELMVQQMADGMTKLCRRIFGRFTTLETIRLLHRCSGFEELATALPELEAKRPAFPNSNDAEQNVQMFLESLKIRLGGEPLSAAVYSYLDLALSSSVDTFMAFGRFYKIREREIVITAPDARLIMDAAGLFLAPVEYAGDEFIAKRRWPAFWDMPTRNRLGRLQILVFKKLIQLATGKEPKISLENYAGFVIQRKKLPNGQFEIVITW